MPCMILKLNCKVSSKNWIRQFVGNCTKTLIKLAQNSTVKKEVIGKKIFHSDNKIYKLGDIPV